MPTNELKLLLSVSHDRVRQTVEYARQWCVYRAETVALSSVPFLRWDLRASFCTIPSTLDRSSIAIPYRDTAEPGFYFDSRNAGRGKSRTKSHACRTTRSNSHRTQSEAAGLIEYQGTINALRGNVDTLAQILQYIVTT